MAVIGVKIMLATFASNSPFMQLSIVVMPLLVLQMVNAVVLVPPSAPQSPTPVITATLSLYKDPVW